MFCRNLGETKDLVHQNATEESDRAREGEREGVEERTREGSRAEWSAIGLPKLLRRKWQYCVVLQIGRARCNGMKSAGDDEPPHHRSGAGKEEEETSE